jgi:hypothetical protein
MPKFNPLSYSESLALQAEELHAQGWALIDALSKLLTEAVHIGRLPEADAKNIISRIKLLVPRRIQRVGKVNAFSVTAYLHHLRAAIERDLQLFRVGSTACDAADLKH